MNLTRPLKKKSKRTLKLARTRYQCTRRRWNIWDYLLAATMIGLIVHVGPQLFKLIEATP